MQEQRTTNVSMDGRVSIVTGANSGVGFQTSKQLARHGAHLVMVCRNEARGTAAKAKIDPIATNQVDLVLGDLGTLDGVRKLARMLLDTYPKIHLLVNNAGIQLNTRTTTPDGFESVFAVNYLSMFLLTNLLLERIKASAPARILNISSKGHRFGGLDLNDLHWEKRKYKGLKGYGASKIATNQFTVELASRLAGTGVTVNAAHPGEVYSNIGMTNGPVYLFIRKHLIDRFLLGPAPAAGEAIYFLAASPALDHVTGKYFNMTHEERPWGESLNRSMGRTLWAISEQLTGLVTPTTTV